MQLLSIFACHKLNCVLVLFLAIVFCMENVKASFNDASKLQQLVNGTSVTALAQKSVKKELKAKAIEEIMPHQNTKTAVVPGDEKPAEASTARQANMLETPTEPLPQHHQKLLGQDFALKNDDIMDSLKIGFYFFSLVSLAAIAFIVFKIFRLRLSRAERKYGVQGDHSNQELTPLPISIEDGHSDDEDQTLFEIQRQNIRIL